MVADWDLLALLALILADVRVFQGSSVASFTLAELFAWGYCLPVVVGYTIGSRRVLPALSMRFVQPLAQYLGWILLASAFALFARQHSDVLQQAKNVMVALPIVCFVSVRLARPETMARLVNLYLLYCLAACVLALLQSKQGGPYLRVQNENNDYKLDFAGDLVGNVVLGLSTTPNELAVVVLPGVMFSALKLVQEVREHRHPRGMTMFCCALTSIPFLLAQSRGAAVWLAFGLAFMVSPLRRSRSFALKLSLVAGVITLLVVYGMQVAPVSTLTVENTVETRFLLWVTSIDAMIDDPYVLFFGDGMDYVRRWSWQIAGWEFPDAHNGWIDQALFFGVPASFLYLAIWQRFFAIADAPFGPGPDAVQTRLLLDGVRGTVLAYMGLYFFEPVAHAVFPVSQLFLLMSCGVALQAGTGQVFRRARRVC